MVLYCGKYLMGSIRIKEERSVKRKDDWFAVGVN